MSCEHVLLCFPRLNDASLQPPKLLGEKGDVDLTQPLPDSVSPAHRLVQAQVHVIVDQPLEVGLTLQGEQLRRLQEDQLVVVVDGDKFVADFNGDIRFHILGFHVQPLVGLITIFIHALLQLVLVFLRIDVEGVVDGVQFGVVGLVAVVAT